MELRPLLAPPSVRVAVGGIVTLLLLAIFAPIFLGHDANVTNLSESGLGAGQAGHLLGTDALGRDVLDRTLVGTRTSLELALLSSAIACVVGSAAGVAVAVSRGSVRAIGSRVIDALLGFPDILFAVLIVTIVGTGSFQAAIAVGIAVVPFFARLAFTLASGVLNAEFVVAAEALGVGRWRRMRRYLAPNIAEPLVIAGFLAISYSIIAISSLSFLGLGVQPPSYDWGSLLTNGLQSIYETPAAALGPAVAIAIAGTFFGIVGELAARAADPRLHNVRATTRGARRRVANGLGARAADAAVSEAAAASERTVLAVRNLSVSFPSADDAYAPVKDVSLEVGHREIVGVVGESGSGKTLAALAIGGLVPYPGIVTAARLRIGSLELKDIDPRKRSKLYRSRLAYVFQDPNGALNPALRIGVQLAETIPGRRVRASTRRQAVDALTEVDVSAPAARLRQYPHQLSGGIKQRVAIAMSLLSKSDLLIADEPTTALDVTVQAQVLSVIRRLRDEEGLSVLLISHSLGVVADLCDRVVVMYAGRIVEEGPVSALLTTPLHPYTRALIDAMPRLSSERSRPLTVIPGRVPPPSEKVIGCPFAPRCVSRFERCSELPPQFTVKESRASCWLHEPGAERT